MCSKQSATSQNHFASAQEDILKRAATNRQNEWNEFRSYFGQIVDKLCDHGQSNWTLGHHLDGNHLSVVNEWMRNVYEYNVPNGKLNRGLTVVINYKLLNPMANEQMLQLARLLGWCMEMFQTCFLLIDDILDGSINRRSQTCWYRLPQVGMLACNDSMLMESNIFHLMHEHLGNHPCYPQLVHLMHEGFRITSVGQCLDVLTEKRGKTNGQPNLEQHYNMDRYRTIVAHKTSFYSFVMPIRLALYLAECTDTELHDSIQSIMLAIGELFQIQDDFLDCFGDPSRMGKIGTDIRDGKCSWLLVEALKSIGTNEQQKEIIIQHYGKEDVQSEIRVKQLYEQLNLEQIYREHHRSKMEEILGKIRLFYSELAGQTDTELTVPLDLFNESLSQICLERTK